MRILITDTIAENAIEMLKENFKVDIRIGLSEDELVAIIPNYDILIVRSSVKVTKKIIFAGSSLKLIARPGVGVDNIDINSATERGIAIINTPLGNVNAAAEHTIGMMIALARHIHKGHLSLKEKKLWERKKFIGIELRDKTLGIIGLGHVGRIVGRIARKGLFMNVIAYDPADKIFDAEELDIKLVKFEELLIKADIISLHVPLIEQTRNLLSEKEFERMKDGVYILNTSRGGIINEFVLYERLKNGKVAGAGIDVWEKEPNTDSPLLDLANVLALPHLGANTIEAQENVAVDIAKVIISSAKTGKLEHSVNGINGIVK